EFSFALSEGGVGLGEAPVEVGLELFADAVRDRLGERKVGAALRTGDGAVVHADAIAPRVGQRQTKDVLGTSPHDEGRLRGGRCGPAILKPATGATIASHPHHDRWSMA